MESSFPDQAGLYPQVLDERWRQLAPAIQAAHLASHEYQLSAVGCFHVQHNRNRLLRNVFRLAGMPRNTEAAAVRLIVTLQGRAEVGRRWFDGRRMV